MIEAETTLRKKNQVTFPDQIVERLGIEAGDRLIFELDEGSKQIRVRPLLRSYAGILQGVYGKNEEEEMAYIREERASWGE